MFDVRCVVGGALVGLYGGVRIGRRGGKEDWTMKLAEPCLMEVEEPDACFSPERRFDEKERRERPPRRYDKTAKVARAQPSIGLV